jgi:hypothetical protein
LFITQSLLSVIQTVTVRNNGKYTEIVAWNQPILP